MNLNYGPNLRRIVCGAITAVAALTAILTVQGCSGLQVAGNENGSEPVNTDEQREYMKAIRRCHKMGGSRIVKVMGELRCF